MEKEVLRIARKWGIRIVGTKGETSEKLVRGLLRVYGDRIAVARSASGGATGLSLDATTLRLYEVHWADILSGERVRGTWDWENFDALSWFPWINWRHGLLPPPEYSALRVFAWTLLLVPASLLLWFVYWGAPVIAMVREGDREQASGPGNVEAPSEGPVASEVNSPTVTLPARWRAFVKRAREDAERRTHQRTAIEKLLDTVAGDVTNYMASLGSVGLGAGSAGPEIASRDILARFHQRPCTPRARPRRSRVCGRVRRPRGRQTARGRTRTAVPRPRACRCSRCDAPRAAPDPASARATRRRRGPAGARGPGSAGPPPPARCRRRSP